MVYIWMLIYLNKQWIKEKVLNLLTLYIFYTRKTLLNNDFIYSVDIFNSC